MRPIITTLDATSAAAQPARAQQLMGEITPKLAQLTDSVLFGDVWARPQPNAVTAATVARDVLGEPRR